VFWKENLTPGIDLGLVIWKLFLKTNQRAIFNFETTIENVFFRTQLKNMCKPMLYCIGLLDQKITLLRLGYILMDRILLELYLFWESEEISVGVEEVQSDPPCTSSFFVGRSECEALTTEEACKNHPYTIYPCEWIGTSSCLTINQKPCVFPFIYKEITYNSCTSVDHKDYWCATKVSEKGEYMWRKWDHCDLDMCPRSCNEDISQITDINTMKANGWKFEHFDTLGYSESGEPHIEGFAEGSTSAHASVTLKGCGTMTIDIENTRAAIDLENRIQIYKNEITSENRLANFQGRKLKTYDFVDGNVFIFREIHAHMRIYRIDFECSPCSSVVTPAVTPVVTPAVCEDTTAERVFAATATVYSDCAALKAALGCDASVPLIGSVRDFCCSTCTPECTNGTADNTNPCMPKQCSGGHWVTDAIDCEEAMGMPCVTGWVPAVQGECCSTCPVCTSDSSRRKEECEALTIQQECEDHSVWFFSKPCTWIVSESAIAFTETEFDGSLSMQHVFIFSGLVFITFAVGSYWRTKKSYEISYEALLEDEL